MKTPLVFLLCLLGVAAPSQTNVIDLQNRPVHFRDRNGREYRVDLVRATLDGVIYSVPGGGGMIHYPDLLPETLVAWGIPTNRITIAAQRAKIRKQAKADYDALAELAAEHKSVQLAMNQVRARYALRSQAARDGLKSAETRVDNLRAQIANDNVLRDQAWARWVYTDYDYASVTTVGRQVIVDTDRLRMMEARALDRRIADNEKELAEAERELEQVRKDYPVEMEEIEREYREQVAAIQAAIH